MSNILKIKFRHPVSNNILFSIQLNLPPEPKVEQKSDQKQTPVSIVQAMLTLLKRTWNVQLKQEDFEKIIFCSNGDERFGRDVMKETWPLKEKLGNKSEVVIELKLNDNFELLYDAYIARTPNMQIWPAEIVAHWVRRLGNNFPYQPSEQDVAYWRNLTSFLDAEQVKTFNKFIDKIEAGYHPDFLRVAWNIERFNVRGSFFMDILERTAKQHYSATLLLLFNETIDNAVYYFICSALVPNMREKAAAGASLQAHNPFQSESEEKLKIHDLKKVVLLDKQVLQNPQKAIAAISEFSWRENHSLLPESSSNENDLSKQLEQLYTASYYLKEYDLPTRHPVEAKEDIVPPGGIEPVAIDGFSPIFSSENFIICGPEGVIQGRTHITVKYGSLYCEYRPGGKDGYLTSVYAIDSKSKKVELLFHHRQERYEQVIIFEDLLPFSLNSFYGSRTYVGGASDPYNWPIKFAAREIRERLSQLAEMAGSSPSLFFINSIRRLYEMFQQEIDAFLKEKLNTPRYPYNFAVPQSYRSTFQDSTLYFWQRILTGCKSFSSTIYGVTSTSNVASAVVAAATDSVVPQAAPDTKSVPAPQPNEAAAAPVSASSQSDKSVLSFLFAPSNTLQNNLLKRLSQQDAKLATTFHASMEIQTFYPILSMLAAISNEPFPLLTAVMLCSRALNVDARVIQTSEKLETEVVRHALFLDKEKKIGTAIPEDISVDGQASWDYYERKDAITFLYNSFTQKQAEQLAAIYRSYYGKDVIVPYEIKGIAYDCISAPAGGFSIRFNANHFIMKVLPMIHGLISTPAPMPALRAAMTSSGT